MEDPKPPRYMSDKAKGKQRAEPIDLAALAPESKLSALAQDSSPNIKFSIRFTDGAQDLRLEIPTTKRVAALVSAVGPSLGNEFTMFSISQIRERRPELTRRKLRLIHGGKNLARTLPLSTLRPNRRLFPETESSETSQGSSLNTGSLDSPSVLDELLWIHCSVGDEAYEDEDERDATAEQVCGFYSIHKMYRIDVVYRL